MKESCTMRNHDDRVEAPAAAGGGLSGKARLLDGYFLDAFECFSCLPQEKAASAAFAKQTENNSPRAPTADQADYAWYKK
jgi:hypothetical protein